MNKILTEPKYIGKVVLYIVLKFAHYGLLLLPPYCYLLFLNDVITMQRFDRLWLIVGAYIVIYVAKTAVTVWNRRVYNQIFPEIAKEYKQKVLEKYIELDIHTIEAYTTGELQERVHKDTENVALYWQKKIDNSIAIISILVTIVILLYLNWVMAVISFLLLPLSFWITRYIKGKSNIEYERKRQLQGKYNDFMINNMFFWKEVKSNCLEEKKQEQFESYWDAMGNAFLKAHICWFMNRTFLAFKDVFLTKMGLYLLGGILVIYKMATVPVLLSFMEYYTDFTNRFLEVADTLMKLGEQEQSVKRVQELLQLPSPKRSFSLEHFESLKINGISFTYDETQENVLDDFSMEINKGDSVAIVGESGCGKSTVIKLMAGCLVSQKGEILWNHHPMEEIKRETLYPKVGFLMQESSLFNLTIRENLQFGRADATEQDMLDACRRANILEFIQGLPQGLETLIGEKGIRLSGGQKQRLQIARLFLQNPEIIVFDEATSALDYENESEILNLLLENMEEKTFIMITHRGTSVARCNRVIKM